MTDMGIKRVFRFFASIQEEAAWEKTDQFVKGNRSFMGSGDYQEKDVYHPHIRKVTMILARLLAWRHFSCCFIFCLFVYLPSISIASAEARIEVKKNVLILNSYHQGYKWTDDETQGAIAGLDPARNDFKVVIEYMGTKWAYAEPYFEQLRRTYKYKFHKIRFDMIIATDDDAFNFLKRNRNELFPNVPVVFCGSTGSSLSPYQPDSKRLRELMKMPTSRQRLI